MIALLNRRPRSGRKKEQEHDEKEEAKSLAGVQGSSCSYPGKQDKTLAELAQQFDCPSEPDHGLKAQFLECSAAVFGEKLAKEPGPDIQIMQAKINELTLVNDSLENGFRKAP